MSISCTDFYKLLAAFFLLGASAAYGADPVLPKELLQDNKPVSPLCFESISADEWQDVTKCGQADIIAQPGLPNDFFNGKIGYQYRFKEDTQAGSTMPYSYYEYVGQWNSSPVVASYTSGGGSGNFTSLMSIEREGNKIRVLQGFGGGDRCNGGITDIRIENGALHYGQWVTPIDFLQLADDNPAELQPYEALEASAASCFGVANYEDGKFVGITLKSTNDETGNDRTGWSEQFTHQICFNKIYRSYLTQNKKDLSIQALKEFTGEFNRLCLADKITEPSL